MNLWNATGREKLFALGRLKTGEMNQTEAAYAWVLEGRKRLGEIAWYKFEGIKLRLADNTFLTIDFSVMLANGELEMHEVKGAGAIFQDDAKVKVKVAAEMYPFRFIVAIPRAKKNGGGWETTVYGERGA